MNEQLTSWEQTFASFGEFVAVVICILIAAFFVAGTVCGWRAWWRMPDTEERIAEALRSAHDARERVTRLERTRGTKP